MNKSKYSRYTYIPQVNHSYDYPLDTYLYYVNPIFVENTDDLFFHESRCKLLDLFGKMLDDDCWATTVENVTTKRSEVLFNFYNPYSSYRNRLMDEMVHSQMLENPESFIDAIVFQNQEVKVRIYMGYERPWTMNVWYKPKGKVFQVSFSRMF